MVVPWIDALGYLASLVILVSLTMRSIVRLRVVNALGSVLFVAFAALTRSLPTVVMILGIVAGAMLRQDSLAASKFIAAAPEGVAKREMIAVLVRYLRWRNENEAAAGWEALLER